MFLLTYWFDYCAIDMIRKRIEFMTFQALDDWLCFYLSLSLSLIYARLRINRSGAVKTRTNEPMKFLSVLFNEIVPVFRIQGAGSYHKSLQTLHDTLCMYVFDAFIKEVGQ